MSVDCMPSAVALAISASDSILKPPVKWYKDCCANPDGYHFTSCDFCTIKTAREITMRINPSRINLVIGRRAKCIGSITFTGACCYFNTRVFAPFYFIRHSQISIAWKFQDDLPRMLYLLLLALL